MDEKRNIFEMISKQTEVDDLLYIEKLYNECNCDAVATIFKVMQVDMPRIRSERHKDDRNIFDDIRTICDEKEAIFQTKMKST